MPFLVPIITASVKTIVISFFSQKMTEEIIFQLLKYATSKTSNTLDDAILAKFEEQRSK
jgi:hypothetical protein